MGTLVTIQVLAASAEAVEATDRAFGWFAEIEERCTRFHPDSELMAATQQTGIAVPLSHILFEAVQFALMLAETTGGAFDPTVGSRMESRGFNREYRTGEIVNSGREADPGATYRDVELDPERRTIRLHRPLILDLGAVAKGLAVDAAARELEPFRDFAIDAGGDLYLGGHNEHGTPWRVGIRHPRNPGELIASFDISNQAVCTSGDYERRIPDAGHHILDARTGASAAGVASATVIAGGAMLADALATAAFVLGSQEGLDLLDRLGVGGLIVTPELAQFRTRALTHAA
jgi:thiamine biosynthesis lipoprotein